VTVIFVAVGKSAPTVGNIAPTVFSTGSPGFVLEASAGFGAAGNIAPTVFSTGSPGFVLEASAGVGAEPRIL